MPVLVVAVAHHLGGFGEGVDVEVFRVPDEVGLDLFGGGAVREAVKVRTTNAAAAGQMLPSAWAAATRSKIGGSGSPVIEVRGPAASAAVTRALASPIPIRRWDKLQSWNGEFLGSFGLIFRGGGTASRPRNSTPSELPRR